jgi:carbon-monoxide dehydrogenase medium subunit
MLRNVKTYHKPTTVEDAVALVQTKANAAYVAGGAWIMAQGDPSLEVLVDLQKLNLDTIEADVDGVRIGATATLQEIIDDDSAGELADGLLAEAARYTQSRNLREQGTLGGTLIVAGPEDSLTTALLVLDAEIFYADPVGHSAPFNSFVAYRDRLIKACALLTELRVKRPPSRSAAALEVVGRSPRDKPIVTAVAYVEVEEGLPVTVRLAVAGADEKPARLLKAEHLLKGQLLTAEKIAAALEPAVAELHPLDDYRGSADYRREMAQVLTHRALLSAWERARSTKPALMFAAPDLGGCRRLAPHPG